MKTLVSVPSVLLLAAVGLASGSAPAPERIVFAPAEGLTLRKLFKTRHSLITVEAEVLERHKESSQFALQQIELESERRFRITDTYLEVEPERPLVFERLYNATYFVAEASLADAGERNVLLDTLRAHGVPNGNTVVFTWVDEDGEYGRYFKGNNHEEEVLRELHSDADLQCLLPGREVSPGDEWNVPVASLREVFAVGGNIPMRFEQTGAIMLARAMVIGVGGGLWYAFAEAPQGSVTARFEGVREESGFRLADISIKAEFECRVDQTELASRFRNAIELSAGIEVESASLVVTFEGDGNLVWNLDANVAHSFSIVGEQDVEAIRIVGPAQADSPALRKVAPSQRLHLIGALRLDLETELPGAAGPEQR